MPAIIRHWTSASPVMLAGIGDRGGHQPAEVGDEALGAGVPHVVLDHLVDGPVDVAVLLLQLLVGGLGGRRQRADAVDRPVQRLADERRRSVRARARVSAGGPDCLPMLPLALMPRSYEAPVGPIGWTTGWLRSCRAGRARPRPSGRSPTPRAFDADDDLVAIGADLEPGTLLAAYRRGLFPMPSGTPRRPMAGSARYGAASLPLDGLVVSRSLRRSCRDFEIRVDTAFAEVVDALRGPAPRRRAGSTARSATAYLRLHELGWAHSVEAWRDGRLVGGLYGVAIGGLFAGESMFHRETDASKVALVGLVELLPTSGQDRLLDTQWQTPHLATLGVVEMPRAEYLRRLPRLRWPSRAAAGLRLTRPPVTARLDGAGCGVETTRRRQTTMKHALIAASLVLVAGAAAGCGGGDDESKPAASPPVGTRRRPRVLRRPTTPVPAELADKTLPQRLGRPSRAIKKCGRPSWSEVGTPERHAAPTPATGFDRCSWRPSGKLADDATQDGRPAADARSHRRAAGRRRTRSATYVQKTCPAPSPSGASSGAPSEDSSSRRRSARRSRRGSHDLRGSLRRR